MRVLIVAFGSHGDVLPLIALGAELVRRGHDVLMAGVEPFAAIARSAGVPFEQLASDAEYREALSHDDLWRPIRGARRLLGFARLALKPTFEFIERNRLRRDVLVVASSLALGARVAQDALKLPVVTVHMSPFLMQSRHAAPRLPVLPDLNWLPEAKRWDIQLGADEWVVDPVVMPALNAFRAELGLKPIKRLRYWWNAPGRVLLMFPDWYAAPQPDWPAQVMLAGFARPNLIDNDDPALDAFLDVGEPPVAITFGTAMRQGAALHHAAIKACDALGRRCLVISAEPVETPRSMAGRVHVARAVSLARVLPRCAAIVHHGGVGTVAEALAAGLPQLLVPLAFDQFDNAARVKALGCGVSLSRWLCGPRRLARALDRILKSASVRAGCVAAATRFEGKDPIALAADAVEAENERAWARKPKRAAAPRPPA